MEEPIAGSASVQHLSRVLYRRLAPLVINGNGAGESNRQRVLDGCEHTMKRLVEEPDFARPARFLFCEIRTNFRISDQLRARRLIDAYIDLVRPLAQTLRDGEARSCSAFSRGGAPCRREACPGSVYCPSHRHLEPSAVEHEAEARSALCSR